MSSSGWRQLRAIAVLPGTVTLLVPAAILYFTRGTTLLGAPSSALRIALVVTGVDLLGLGLTLMVQTIRLFAQVGEGTLAPWEPTQKLVVRGIQHLRNPMISGVIAVLLAEAALFASVALLAWALGFALANAIYIPIFEEPGLERRFGADYLEYKRHVPRWIPRLRPWTPPAET